MKIFAETERLILREILETDLDGMFELDSDPEVHHYLGNQTVSDKNQTAKVINYVRQQYIDNGIGRWAVIDKRTNAFIGWTGLKFVTELTNGRQNYYDLGYRLKRVYWGQGIATETALISLDYAFNKLKIDEVYAAANCENLASNKILQKVGMRFMETFYYEDILCNWYKIDRNIYERKSPK
jgi:ribosomal-protein-alanine N-acetyltransferase